MFVEVLSLVARVFWAYIQAFAHLIYPGQPKNVAEKVVLVTGAGSGIGRCLALTFARNGARLALWDINKEGNDATAEEINTSGGTAHSYVCDITKSSSIHSAANQVRRDLGEVDILVNNAGVIALKEFCELDEQTIRRTIDVNMLAHFWTLQEFLPNMMAANRGHIVTIASMSAKFGTPLLTAYTASKFGVYGLIDSLSEELRRYGKRGIHFTTVYPLFVNTPMIVSDDDVVCKLSRGDRLLEPAEVAEQVFQGVVYNRQDVFLPHKSRFLPLINELFPKRVKELVMDFMEAGYYKRSE